MIMFVINIWVTSENIYDSIFSTYDFQMVILSIHFTWEKIKPAFSQWIGY